MHERIETTDPMIANLALYGWPLVVMILFQKYRIAVALLVAIIGGYLLLPEIEGLDLPLLPALNKSSIPALTALLFAAMAVQKVGPDAGRWMASWVPKGIVPRLLLVMLVAGSFLTVATNGDRVPFPTFSLPGLRVYDGFSTVLSTLILLLPFFLGYRLLAHPNHQKLLLAVFAVAAAGYAFLALYEIRMSPQLNNMVYGFFPHSWLQHIRAGGYRPLVFLHHGLWLAIFFCMASLAAVGAAQAYPEKRGLFLAAGGWILMTLALSNSLGGLVLAILLLPVAFFLGLRVQLLIGVVVAATVIAYPALRGGGTITGEGIVEFFAGIDADRASSLEYRIDNENILLEKARERPLFGWGGYGRSRVFNEEGVDISTTDGYWVIIIGVGGWTRYIGEFGLMTLPVFALFWRRRSLQPGPETGVIVLMLTANLMDLIPNGTMTSLTMMLAGAIWGRLELGRIKMGASPEDADSGVDDDGSVGNVRSESKTISPYTRQTRQVHRR